LPAWARCGLARLLDSRLTVAAGAVYRLSDLLRPSARRQVLVEDKIRKVAAAAEAEDRAEFFHRLATYWMEPERLVPGATGAASLFTETAEQPRIEDYAEWMMAMDQATYLPDDILTKVDRASMAYSLEARVPLIDHRVVEFSHTLPQNMKVTDVGKKLLRKILYRYLPRDTVERPKQGFGVPMETWLRGPLRDWTEELLRRERLQSQGLLDPTPVRRAWETHLSGKSNLQHHLWAVLMFQAWMENQP
jgi:asparagine synthase (glutamine-hydrolysing)